MDFNRQVSVIVPVYNVEDYLKRCLDSLISQTIDKKEMEVILIDDGSTDNSPALCDEYAQKYDYIKVFHVENKGVSNARNFGIDKAQGKYIMYLDSDDYLSKNSVKGLKILSVVSTGRSIISIVAHLVLSKISSLPT